MDPQQIAMQQYQAAQQAQLIAAAQQQAQLLTDSQQQAHQAKLLAAAQQQQQLLADAQYQAQMVAAQQQPVFTVQQPAVYTPAPAVYTPAPAETTPPVALQNVAASVALPHAPAAAVVASSTSDDDDVGDNNAPLNWKDIDPKCIVAKAPAKKTYKKPDGTEGDYKNLRLGYNDSPDPTRTSFRSLKFTAPSVSISGWYPDKFDATAISLAYKIPNTETGKLFLEKFNAMQTSLARYVEQYKYDIGMEHYSATTPFNGMTNMLTPEKDQNKRPVPGGQQTIYFKIKPHQTKWLRFIGLDGQTVNIYSLKEVSFTVVDPVFHITYIYAGTGKASPQIQIVGGIVTKLEARGASQNQMAKIDELRAKNPALFDEYVKTMQKLQEEEAATKAAVESDKAQKAAVPALTAPALTAPVAGPGQMHVLPNTVVTPTAPANMADFLKYMNASQPAPQQQT